jgi:Putative Flp pilus-assembly TadE/G-like
VIRLRRRREGSEKGQVFVMVAAALTVLLGFSALVVDVGMLWNAQQNHRSIADAAALAGAQEMQIYGLRGINSAAREEARYAAMQQIKDRTGATAMPTCAVGGAPTSDLDGDGKMGYAADVRNCAFPGTDFMGSVLSPSAACRTCEIERSIMVEVASGVPTFFAGLFGRDSWAVRKTSVATITYSADFAVLTLRPPVVGSTTNAGDVSLNGSGTHLHVSIGDIGTNTNMVLTGGALVTIDEGYKAHHYDAAPAWTQPPPAKKLINLITDPNHGYPTRVGVPTFANLAAARMTDAECNTLRAGVPTLYKWGGVAISAVPDVTKIQCLKPGIYTFMPVASTQDMILFAPGAYFFDAGLRVRSVAIGGYEAGSPGVVLVFTENSGGRLDANNAEVFALNAGGRFAGGTGAEATAARAIDGVPVQTGGELNLVITLMVTKDPNCVPVTPYPTACNDNGNKALSMAGGGSLYLAGVQYAPTDNVTFSGGSAGQGNAGRIVAWTVTYSGGTKMIQQYPGEREGNGILRLDAACTGAGTLSMSSSLCNP